MCASFESSQPAPLEGYLPVESAELYYREIGQGHPIVILHGGPDFSHSYLLPEMDRLSDSFRLIYYDQRGRGKYVGVTDLEVAIHLPHVRWANILKPYLLPIDLSCRSLLVGTFTPLPNLWGTQEFVLQ